MTIRNEELNEIVTKFAESGWDLIDESSKLWLEGKIGNNELLPVIKKADEACGSCGCEFDPLYKKAMEMLKE